MLGIRSALIVALVFAGGCGRGAEPPREDVTLEKTEAASAAEEAGRDLAAVDVCTMVPAADVAKAVGGTVDAEPSDWDPGWGGKGCRYKTRVAGSAVYTEIGLVPPGDYEFLRQSAQVATHDVAGLADAGYWAEHSDRSDLYALKRGDVVVWIRSQIRDRANTEAELRPIAEVVLARL